MLETQQWEEIIEALESYEDQGLANKQLKELSDLTRAHGKLILDKTPDRTLEQWKKDCDGLQEKITELVQSILSSTV